MAGNISVITETKCKYHQPITIAEYRDSDIAE